MRNYRTIEAWQKAHALVMDVFRAVQGRRCSYTGLRSQLLRAADAVPSCIVEGCGKETDAELTRFLDMAHASGNELDYHLLKARDVGLLTPTEYDSFAARADEVRRMIHGFVRSLRERQARGKANRGR